MSRFLLEREDDGTGSSLFRARRNGHGLGPATYSVSVALNRIRQGYEEGDTVFLVEEDGYRTNLTRDFERGSERRRNYSR